MARPFTGQSSIEAARQARDSARTAGELRIAVAVLLPLEAGLSLAQTALVLGRSRYNTCALRTARRKKFELRNRAQSTLRAEAAVLDGTAEGAVLVILKLKEKIEAQLPSA